MVRVEVSAETVFSATFLAFWVRGSAAGAAGIDEGVQRCRYIGKGCAINGIAGALAVGLEADQTGLDQYFQMLRDGRLRQIETVDDLAATTGFAGREVLQYLDAGGMRQRGKSRRDITTVGDTVG
ncbi:hypothetical protein MesoLj113b_48780 [Mesorhizobium sp. 113-3-3]|nr:hypothetical protein MesoLj113b_48780 [Mesorhizobium sp. 113-3-3]